MSMKTAQEAKQGDRVWVKRYPTRHLEEVVIDNPEHWTESDDFNEDWGYLADNETVIGGHVRKHSAADKPKRTARDAKIGDDVWVRDGTSHVVFEGGVKFIDTATISPRGYGLSIVVGATPYIRDQCTFGTDWGFWEDRPQAQEAKPEQPAISPFEAAIQDHVRKHSGSAPITHWAPLPEKQPEATKRTASDVEIDDEIYVMTNGKPLYRVVAKIKPCVNVKTSRGAVYDFSTFGSRWGFWEDRPQPEPKAKPQPQAQPKESAPLPPQLGNVALLIKHKGIDWVKSNIPDAWKAYREAGKQQSEREYEEMRKPGPLAGKTASPWG